MGNTNAYNTRIKGDELYDVPTYCTKFLKYDPFLPQIESICHI
jgi:hypothetical protein